MSHIFISYSSKDRSKTRALAKVFENQGWKVWWDKNLPPGKAFDRSIGKALDEASCIVVLWSPNSVESAWVLDEAYEGLERDILVPALSEETRLPFGYRRRQYIDLTNWNGKTKNGKITELLNSIEIHYKVEAPRHKVGNKLFKGSPTAKIKKQRNLAGALDGKTIVFTGALSESRRAHEEKVKAVGARFVDSVSSKTNYLVVGKDPGAVKLKSAEKLGVKKITEKKWKSLLDEAYKRTLHNKQLVFTGKLHVPRKELEAIAKKLGAKPTQTISGKTDFLIVGDNPGKVKMKAAEEKGVKIMSEELWKDIADTL